MNIITDKNTILDFLSGWGTDYQGRRYSEMVAVDDVRMEECHDQIQWMFPLHEGSNFAFCYPIINSEISKIARTDVQIIKNILSATNRMHQFFGIGLYYNTEKWTWCKDLDHNLLRITRIIRSLRLFGLESDSRFFFTSVSIPAIKKGVMKKTLEIWTKALTDDPWKSLR